MIKTLLAKLNADPEDILEMTVVGNPVMLHLFLGADPRGLGHAPYMGLFRDAFSVPGKPGNDHASCGRVRLLPQIAGFGCGHCGVPAGG